jgi:hypothetical protein
MRSQVGWLLTRIATATNKPRDFAENVRQMGGSFRIKVIRSSRRSVH